jgi:hypothetical protein
LSFAFIRNAKNLPLFLAVNGVPRFKIANLSRIGGCHQFKKIKASNQDRNLGYVAAHSKNLTYILLFGIT